MVNILRISIVAGLGIGMFLYLVDKFLRFM
jgi:hypothetical protein